MVARWLKLEDCYAGEETIKSAETIYLPATASMLRDGYPNTALGIAVYGAYKLRAEYPEYVRDAIETLVGVMHREPANIALPPEMEALREHATLQGETIQQLLRRENEAQLLPGRFGLLFEFRADGTPYICTYEGTSIINWDEDVNTGNLNLVVLDETTLVRKGFDWEEQEQFRVLGIDDAGNYYTQLFTSGLDADSNKVLVEGAIVHPKGKGQLLKSIPFVFVNPADMDPCPDMPPLLGLANKCLAIYRQEADYKQALFMQGQDTLVISGADPETTNLGLKVGAGASIVLSDSSAKAYYVGASGLGIPEMRQALEAAHREAITKSSQLLSDSRHREAAEALSIRVSARTSSLLLLAKNGGDALQAVLRKGAVMMGLDPLSVKVEPSLDFTDSDQDFQKLKFLMEAVKEGDLPLSMESIHNICKDWDLTNMTFAQETLLIDQDKKKRAQEAKVNAENNVRQPGRDSGGAGGALPGEGR